MRRAAGAGAGMNTPFERPPAWVSDAVFYQVFPDRFARSDRLAKPANLEDWDSPPTVHGYKGGDLVGISERLDWLVDLGVTAIYLNPIFQSAANHRYHTHDYLRVDPLLGGDRALRRLLDACHERGLRVMLDGVFNHASRGFFQFNDLLENGAQSPWIDWFIVDDLPLNAYSGEVPNYAAWWGLPALPKLNTDNPHVAEFLWSVATHWVEFGIDGWRLDVPEEITTPGFWEEFRRRVRAVDPDLYIVGEIWGEATDWIAGGERFDGTMNYLFGGWTLAFTAGGRISPALAAGLDYPLTPPLDGPAYSDRIRHLLAAYPPTVGNLNLVGSHDTPRALTVAAGDVTSVVLANLLLFTFPGAPCIYYGDEIGLEGGRDPENRASFPWERPGEWNEQLLESIRSLTRLRAAHPALRSTSYRILPSPPGSGLFWALRGEGDEPLLVAVNAGENAVAAQVEHGPVEIATLWGGGGASSDRRTLRVALSPRSGAVWRLQVR